MSPLSRLYRRGGGSVRTTVRKRCTQERRNPGAAFGGAPTADPTRYPLRVHLLTDDDRLCALPWATIAYQGRRLASDGWTVELHTASHAGFPEYPPHTCYFPRKVVLIGAGEAAQTPQGVAHLHDVHHFFHRHWQQAPEPVLVRTNTELRAALHSGSTRLVYHYGAASRDGLLLEGAERCFPWSELAELLQRSRSVSAVFLNPIGDAGFSAISRRSQRAELSTAQHEFYTFKDRRIYQAVAFGTAGCRVTEFPAMASQHLRYNKREQEIYLYRSFRIPIRLDAVQRVDDLVRQQLGIAIRQSVLSALLGQETMRGSDF